MLYCYETQDAGKTNIGYLLPQRKMFHLSNTILADDFLHIHMAILSDFHRQNPETTLQHDMARELRFHFLLEEEWNF